MSRRILGIAGLAASVALIASGCAGTGGSSNAGSDSKAADPNAQVTIDFWSNHPASSKALEEELIKRFEAANPNIKVKLTDAGKNYEEVAQKFNASLAGGNVPDVVVASDVNWFNFALNGQFAELDKLIDEAKGDAADYIPNFYDEYKYNGSHYAVPYSRSTPLFYYNKDMWAKAGLPDRGPKTWEEWDKDFAPKLKSVVPAGTTPMVLPDGTNYLDWYFQGMMWSLGGAYSKDWTMAMGSPESVKAGEFLQAQVKNGNVSVAKDATAPFVAGQTAAILESTGSLKGIGKDGKIKFGTAFLPAPDGVNGCSTGGAGLAIPAKSKNQAAAAKFITFITNPENTVFFSQGTGYMPVRTSALQLPEVKKYIEENPNYGTALDQLSHTQKQDVARAYVPGGGIALGAALDKVTSGADVKATFDAVDKELQAKIDSQIKPKLK